MLKIDKLLPVIKVLLQSQFLIWSMEGGMKKSFINCSWCLTSWGSFNSMKAIRLHILGSVLSLCKHCRVMHEQETALITPGTELNHSSFPQPSRVQPVHIGCGIKWHNKLAKAMLSTAWWIFSKVCLLMLIIMLENLIDFCGRCGASKIATLTRQLRKLIKGFAGWL